MRTFRELRQDAWAKATRGWCGRVIVAYALLALVVVAVAGVLEWLVGGDLQTWEKFLESKAQVNMSGLDYTVPSVAAARQMTLGTIVNSLFKWLFGGIMSFGLAAVLLKAVKGDEKRWLGVTFGGFMRPLGVLWLTVRMAVQIFLWALLFVIPGVIAAYRYSMAWYVKAEHPDWSAGRCLGESGRLMKGYKWKVFLFSCTYAGWIALAFAATFIPVGIVELLGVTALPLWASAVSLGVTLVGLSLIAFVFVYAALGKAFFYLEVKRLAPAAEGTVAS